MAVDRLKIKVFTYDSATQDEVEIDQSPQYINYTPETDLDVELEVVHDREGNPLVRPKQAPHY